MRWSQIVTTSKGFNSGNKAAEEAQEIRACVVNYYKILIPGINEATDTDLKVIDPVENSFLMGRFIRSVTDIADAMGRKTVIFSATENRFQVQFFRQK